MWNWIQNRNKMGRNLPSTSSAVGLWLSVSVCVCETGYIPSFPTHSHTHAKPAADTILRFNHHTFTSLRLICKMHYCKHTARKRNTPTSLARYSLPFVHEISLRRRNSTRVHCCQGLLQLSPTGKQCRSHSGTSGLLTVLGGVTRWGLRYCDVLRFPKCVDEKIGPCCRCLNMLQCKQEEECHHFCYC